MPGHSSDSRRHLANRDSTIALTPNARGELPAYLGLRHVWGKDEPVGLHVADRRRHVHVIGKTGTGKTTLLRNLILQDIHAGRGVGVIDPHGDLASDLLDQIPPQRTDDVVYFSPADHDFPIGFNMLGGKVRHVPHLMASGIVGAFKSIWGESWGPRLEYLLYAAVAALAECQNVTLLGVQRMLADARYRRWVVEQVTDPMVRSFWFSEFANYDKRFLAEVISPVQNKVGQLLMAPPLRNVLGQVRRKVDPRFMMDDGRILIADLSKGRLGEDKANLMGALLVNAFQLAALSRTDVPEEERRDFFLYVDEFHNFTTDAFTTILAEARKYRLCLTLSHQYLDQVRPAIRSAMLGNVGTIISFRVGHADSQLLAREFGGEYSASQFTSLGNYEMCVQPLEHGVQVKPYIATAMPPLDLGYRRRENLICRSREKYARPRQVVEEKIRRWIRGS